jgi:hypothetical protein
MIMVRVSMKRRGVDPYSNELAHPRGPAAAEWTLEDVGALFHMVVQELATSEPVRIVTIRSARRVREFTMRASDRGASFTVEPVALDVTPRALKDLATRFNGGSGPVMM